MLDARQTYACCIKLEPFTIAVDEEVLTELRERIARTRWPDHISGSGWQYGTDVEYLRSLLASWAEFDWRMQETELNRLGHYRVEIDGLRIHFMHERGKARRRCRSCSRTAFRARSSSTWTCCRC